MRAALAAVMVALMAGGAIAQTSETTEDKPEWRNGPRDEREAAVLAIAPPTHEIQASLGGSLGMTGQTPGGLRVQGEYDRLLTGPWWLDLHAAAVFGADERACYFDRADDFQCDHGAADGLALLLGGGIVRHFAGWPAFTPYARAGGELGLVDFGADSVSGFALILRGGAGVRWRLSDKLGILGEGDLALGAASLSGDRKDPVSGTLASFEFRFGLAFAL